METTRGEPDTYQIMWKSGHIDTMQAHQVSWPDHGFFNQGPPREKARVRFHAEIDGQWRLMLEAEEDEISGIRNVTQVADQP